MANKPYLRNQPFTTPSTLLIEAVPLPNKCVQINAIILSALLFFF